ncbi:unnamed protein product [Urochloa decumbens]|uniref:Uncharacterized protein n=1 Tax=Urochloa decumbens TaxID=240449 RepID=A0ABC8ZXU6_9POAL
MQKRVVLVSAAVAALGLAATVSGFLAEATKSKAFVGYDGRRCLYRRTPALVFGVAAALLALAALALASAASGCFGRSVRYAYAPPEAGRRRSTVARLSIIAWVLVAVAAALFLYGAAMNRGGTRSLSVGRRGRFYDRTYYYGCAVLKSGIFSTASILAAAASASAVAAYVYLQRADEAGVPGQFVAPGVAMGQPQQWSQPYPPPGPAYPPPPAMAYPYPSAPPPYGGGYGAKQPAGPA